MLSFLWTFLPIPHLSRMGMLMTNELPPLRIVRVAPNTPGTFGLINWVNIE